MQTHYLGPKGFRRTRLNVKRYTSFQLKNMLNVQVFYFIFVVMQGLKVIKILKVVGFRVQAWLPRNVSLSSCLLLKC